MNLQQRLASFEQLGTYFRLLASTPPSPEMSDYAGILQTAIYKNPWLDTTMLQLALCNWASMLTKDSLASFCASYNLPLDSKEENILIISAGNVPFVALHDIVCVLLNGYTAIVKISHQDAGLTKLVYLLLLKINKEWASKLVIEEEMIPKNTNLQAIIATGSNNSARYFEHYFGKYSHIIRKNRTSIAVLNGQETDAEIKELLLDITTYYGLGCRNVAKLFLPQGYDIVRLCSILEKEEWLLSNHHYGNNYQYQRAIYLMNLVPHYDTGTMLLVQSEELHSPIAMLYYSFYDNITEVENWYTAHKQEIQCVISNNLIENSIDFGTAQQPSLLQFADNVDTMQFIQKLNTN